MRRWTSRPPKTNHQGTSEKPAQGPFPSPGRVWFSRLCSHWRIGAKNQVSNCAVVAFGALQIPFCEPIFPDPVPKFPIRVVLRLRLKSRETQPPPADVAIIADHLMPRMVRDSLYFSLSPGNPTTEVEIEFRHRHPGWFAIERVSTLLFKCGNRLHVNPYCGGRWIFDLAHGLHFQKKTTRFLVYRVGRRLNCVGD